MRLKAIIYLAWLTPLMAYSGEAHAWGLFTHLHLAQHLILAMPLLDPKFRRVMQTLPKLVLTGACLPDLALLSKQFKTTHQWPHIPDMLAKADSDEALALTIGYTSHLYVDMLAHNHFVPAFEAKWMHYSLVTHVVSEWAMDAHVSTSIQHRPYTLIKQHLAITSEFVATHFSVPQQHATRALQQLAWADKLLRTSGLAHLLLVRLRMKDAELIEKLNYYLEQAYMGLHQFEAVLLGDTPKIQPELHHLSVSDMHTWREKCIADLSLRLNTPIHAFHDYHEQFRHPH